MGWFVNRSCICKTVSFKSICMDAVFWGSKAWCILSRFHFCTFMKLALALECLKKNYCYEWIMVVITPCWGPGATVHTALASEPAWLLHRLSLPHSFPRSACAQSWSWAEDGQRAVLYVTTSTPSTHLLSGWECPDMIFIGWIPAPGCCHPLLGCP